MEMREFTSNCQYEVNNSGGFKCPKCQNFVLGPKCGLYFVTDLWFDWDNLNSSYIPESYSVSEMTLDNFCNHDAMAKIRIAKYLR